MKANLTNDVLYLHTSTALIAIPADSSVRIDESGQLLEVSKPGHQTAHHPLPGDKETPLAAISALSRAVTRGRSGMPTHNRYARFFLTSTVVVGFFAVALFLGLRLGYQAQIQGTSAIQPTSVSAQGSEGAATPMRVVNGRPNLPGSFRMEKAK